MHSTGGGGDSAFYIAHESEWYRIANKYGFLLISIENHLNSTATEMIKLIDKLKEKYPIDEKRLYNKLLLDHGNAEDPFELTDESDGTIRLFDLIPLLHETGNNKVIMIDEIDQSLHTSLVRKFYEVFFKKTEGDACQLIATTHNENIMDLDLFRQDEIWLVERQKDHSSSLYSLNKYKARFDKKVNNDYLLGKYGAVPQFSQKYLQVING